MSSDIEVRSDGAPWGEANPLRGAKYHDLAVAFLSAFPLGTTLSPDAFDTWAQNQGRFIVPPKTSAAWQGHVQRRNELRSRINTASRHPRMETPFSIDVVRPDLYEVRSPQVAASKQAIPARVQSLTETRKRQLAYLLQAVPWSDMEPHERFAVESLYYEIENFEETLCLHTRQLEAKFARVETNLTAKGIIPPRPAIEGPAAEETNDEAPA